jgi:hypothetical protein
MKLRKFAALTVTAVLVFALSTKADEKSPTSQRFEALKGLVGDWVAVDKDGKPTDQVVTSFRLTAGGSALQETMFPGTNHEMLTMYHLDGSDLILTHYCALGNQPRMRAEPGNNANKIVFKFFDGTNLKSADAQHMHQATLTIDGKDHFKSEWVLCQDGKPCHEKSFDLVRKQP